MKRAALYLRVSTDDQNCDMQQRDLLRVAKQRGLEISKVYRDDGWSGAKANRPAFDEMLHDAKRGRFSVLLCWKLDRLGRSLSNLLRLLEDLRVWNVGLISYSESLDLDSPSGRLMYQLISAFSEYEREIIRSRVRSGLAAAKARGVPLGRPPKQGNKKLTEADKQQMRKLRRKKRTPYIKLAAQFKTNVATAFDACRITPKRYPRL